MKYIFLAITLLITSKFTNAYNIVDLWKKAQEANSGLQEHHKTDYMECLQTCLHKIPDHEDAAQIEACTFMANLSITQDCAAESDDWEYNPQANAEMEEVDILDAQIEAMLTDIKNRSIDIGGKTVVLCESTPFGHVPGVINENLDTFILIGGVDLPCLQAVPVDGTFYSVSEMPENCAPRGYNTFSKHSSYLGKVTVHGVEYPASVHESLDRAEYHDGETGKSTSLNIQVLC